MLQLPAAVYRVVPFQFFDRDLNRDFLLLAGLEEYSRKAFQLFHRTVDRGVFKACVDLADFRAGAFTGIFHCRADQDAVLFLLRRHIAEGKAGVAQAVSVGNQRLYAVFLKPGVAVIVLIVLIGGFPVDMRKVFFPVRYDVGEFSGRIDVPEKDLRKGSAALHAGIISHDHGVHVVVPFGHHDHIPADQDYDRFAVFRSDGLDQGDILLVQAQALLAVSADAARIVAHLVFGYEFTLIIVVVADHEDNLVRAAGSFFCRLQVGAVREENFGIRGRFLKTGLRGDDIGRAHPGGAVVADVLGSAEFADQGDLLHAGSAEGKGAAVLDQGNAFLGGFFGDSDMLRAADDRHVIFFVAVVKREDRADDAEGGVIDALLGHKTVLNSFDQAVAEPLGVHHLHILAAVGAFHGVTDAPHKVGHDESVEIPFLFQNLVQKIVVVSAVNAVVAVVGAHDAGGACVDAVFEMGEENFLFRSLVAGDGYLEAGVLHIIESIMLYAGHDVLILDAPHQSRAHLSQMCGLLAVDLLGTTPARIIGHVDADSCKEIRAERARFPPDDMSDFLFQILVKSRAAGHGYRETGGLPVSADDSSGTVGKTHRRKVIFFDSAGVIRSDIVMIVAAEHLGHHFSEFFRT